MFSCWNISVWNLQGNLQLCLSEWWSPLLLCLPVFLSCPCWQIRLVKVLRQQLCAPAVFCPVPSVVPGNEPTLGIGKLKYTAKNKHTAVHRLTMHCCQQFCQHSWGGSTGRGWDHLSHFAKLWLGICVLWFQDLGAGTVFVLYLFSVTQWSSCYLSGWSWAPLSLGLDLTFPSIRNCPQFLEISSTFW